MDVPNVVITETAQADLDEIWEYIARDSERMADRWIDRLLAEARLLAEMPNKGHVRSNIGPHFRFWPVGRYLIIYRPDVQPLEVVHVFSGYRDVSALLMES